MVRPAGVLVVVVLAVAACSSDDGPTATPSTSSTPTTAADPVATTVETTTACAPLAGGRDLAYVPDGDPRQVLDLYVPSRAGCDPVPLVVWVHGGGWRTGDKRSAIEEKVTHWTDAGWAVASVNYRLTDADLPEAARVMAPDHNTDVAAAMGWLVQHAVERGIDPERLALLGHSAGAGIVAALAADPTYLSAVDLTPADLGCVAPLDTEAFDIARAATTPPLTSIYQDAFGTDPDRWAELSPQTHVGEAEVPDLFLVTRGSPARRAVVAAFAEAAEGAGAEVTVVDLPSFSHADVNRRIGDPADTQLTPALDGWLTDCLAD
jgi:acetyl esterase/lipase